MLVKQKIAQLGDCCEINRTCQYVSEKNSTLIGSRLREERERLELSQESLAGNCEVSRRTQVAWEKGEQFPNAEVLSLMAAIGVDVLYVVTGQHTAAASSQLTDAESVLLTRFRSGSPTLRGYLQEIGAAPAAGNTVSIGGDVGQSIAGDASFSAPVSFGSPKRGK